MHVTLLITIHWIFNYGQLYFVANSIIITVFVQAPFLVLENPESQSAKTVIEKHIGYGHVWYYRF